MNRNAFGWVMLVLSIATGCSKGDSDGLGTRDGKDGSGGRAVGSGGADTGGSGKGFSNADASVIVPHTPAPEDAGKPDVKMYDEDAALSSGNACGIGTAMVERKPVNMFVMFDRSGSMNDDNKWTSATAALSSFFQNPAAEKLSVALRFFPHDSPAVGCTDDACDAVACSQPLVPIGALSAEAAPNDAQEQLLLTAITDSAPAMNMGGLFGGGGGGMSGGTPIYAALDGALRWSTAYAAMHTEQTTVVIFVTDGEPNGCEEDFTTISTLASTALMSGVPTYAIGLAGSSTAQMDQLALAGGTRTGIYIDSTPSAQEDLLAALNAIRAQTLSCDFPMPVPADADMTIDPTKVNVTFTPEGGMAATLGQVTDEAACSGTKAWHYDTPDSPTRIVLCPAACELVRSAPEAKLEILLGCSTVCGGLDIDCGGEPPPEVPPIIID